MLTKLEANAEARGLEKEHERHINQLPVGVNNLMQTFDCSFEKAIEILNVDGRDADMIKGIITHTK